MEPAMGNRHTNKQINAQGQRGRVARKGLFEAAQFSPDLPEMKVRLT